MAKARAFDKRRKSVRNIRKITRTMELIATARFKKAMDRAAAATSYTARITQLVKDLGQSGLTVSHPLLEARPKTDNAVLLVLTSNRGLCGGYNGGVLRQAFPRLTELQATIPNVSVEIAGKRGIAAAKYRKQNLAHAYTNFEDKPSFAEVEALANRYLADYAAGRLDRLDVAYTRFVSLAKQEAVVETLLPLGSLDLPETQASKKASAKLEAAPETESKTKVIYEFAPSAESILEAVVPASFKVRLFKCFLDAAVSEQIARMVAMKGATDAAGKMIKSLTQKYNRARQSQITSEIIEI
ncbi:MAG TPA: ATP synthase F1 subunit gamma, partial [Pirellulales bacterium]